MANDIGIKIGVDGEAEFKSALSAINSQLKNLSSEMKATVTSMTGLDTAENNAAKKTDVLTRSIEATKQKISLIQGEYDRVKAKLNELGTALERAKEEFGENSDEALDAEKAYNKQAKTVNDLGTKLNNAQADLNRMESEMRQTGDAADDLGDALEEAGTEASSFGNIFKGTFAASLATRGLDLAVDALRSGISGMMNAGQDFTSSMSQVAATMGITTEEINAGSEAYEMLSAAAKEAGATTPYSASEAADALNYLALAGYDAATAAEVLPTVLNLAAASGMELADASDLATDAMSALNIEANAENLTSFGDKLAVTASKANTSVSQLGEAILTVGGTANTLSGGVTEVNAALGVLANRGIKSAEGGTHLRNIILSLSTPTDKAAASLNALGVEVYDNEGKMRSLNDIFLDMNEALSTMSEGEKTNVLSNIFNKTDLSAANAMLAGCGTEFESLATAIDHCDGAMQNMADTQLNNLSGDLAGLGSAAESVGIALYQQLEPGLRAVVQGVTSFLQNLQSLLPVIVGVTVAVGSFAVAVNMAAILTAVSQAIEKVKAAMLLLNATMAANPILLVVSLIAGLVAALVTAYNTSDTFRAKADAAFQAVKSVVQTVISAVVGFLTTLGAAFAQIGQTAAGMASSIAGAFSSAKAAIVGAVQNIIAQAQSLKTKIVSAFNGAVSAIQQLPGKMASIGGQIVSGIWSGISAKIGWLKSQISGFCSSVSSTIKGFFRISSPSRLMRDEVGVMLVRGIAEGFEDGEIYLVDAVEGAFDRMERIAKKSALAINDAITDKIEELNGEVSAIQAKAQKRQAEKDLAAHRKSVQEKNDKLVSLEKDLEKDIAAVRAKGAKNAADEIASLNAKYLEDRGKTLEELEKLESDWAEKELQAEEKAQQDALKVRIDALSDFQKEYESRLNELVNKQETMQKKLASYGELFSWVKGRNDKEVLKLGDIQKDIDALSEYSDLLNRLMERGVPVDLRQKVLDMDVKDATAYMKALLKKTDEEYEKYMALWNEKQELAKKIAHDYYDEQFTELKDEFVVRAVEEFNVMKDDLTEVGLRAAEGLAAGIWSGRDAVIAAAQAVAAAARAALQSAEGIHSPAKKWMPLGDSMAQGIGAGFEKRMESVAKTITGSIPSADALAREQSAAGIVNGIVGGLASLNQGQPSQAVTLQVNLDGKTVARTIFDPLKDVSKQRGVSLG